MNDTVGTRIRALRQQHNLTQERLAELLDVSTQFIYQMEHNIRMPSVVTLIKLSDIFDTSIDYLLKGRKMDKGDELDLLLSKLSQGERNLMFSALKCLKNKK